MELIDGAAVAAELTLQVKNACAKDPHAMGRPGLAVVIVGHNPASEIYVRKKIATCQEVGFHSEKVALEEGVPQHALLGEIDRLNADPSIHGILVQMPLPAHIDPRAVIDRIDPRKDVDGFHPFNAGRLAAGIDSLWPCTPSGCMHLLDHYGIAVGGAEAVVVGRSNIVGKPMALMLVNRGATVTVCNSRTPDLAGACARADILVAAAGRPGMVGEHMVKPGAAVIDVGINRVDGKVTGDVDFGAVSRKAGHLTPVPGGVGPMTIAKLVENTLKAAQDIWSQADEGARHLAG